MTSTAFSRRDLLLLLALAASVALFFWRILTPNSADRAEFPAGDFTDQFYTFRLYEAQSFATGRLPLWSENYNSGHPFLADIQAAVFYLPALANTLLNVALTGPHFSLFGLELEALLHFWLAGVFTYLFARRLIGSRAGAFMAALVFTFGGYLTSYPPLQLAILETATWLPLALYFLDRGLEFTSSPFPESEQPIPERSQAKRTGEAFKFFVLAGITLAIAGLAGHPQTLLFVIITCVVYFAFRVMQGHADGRLQAIRYLLLTFVVAAGIAAVQWVPTLEYQQLSTRAALEYRQAAAGFPTLDLLQFIFPGFTTAFASPLYVGILPLWLSLFALLRRSRERYFWGLLALGALLLSLGFYVFAYALIYLLIPGATLFREQERFALIISFALAILSGFGFHDLLEAIRSREARKVFPLLPAGVLVSFALLLAFFVASANNPSGRLAFLGDRAGLMLLIFGLATLLVGVFLKGWLTPRALAPLAILLVLFDLFSVNEPANKATPQDRLGPNSLVQTVKQDPGLYRVANENQLPGHFGIAYQLEEIDGISPLRLARYQMLLNLPQAKVWPLLGVKYVFTARPGMDGAELTAQDGGTRLLRLSHFLPRAWLVGSAQVESDDEQAIRFLQSDGFDPSATALLAAHPPFQPDQRAVAGTVSVTAHEPERMMLTVNTPADGILVVAENWYPGWQARVDGVSVDLPRADVSLRAVPLRAGSHLVELEYDPLSLKIGGAITALSLLATFLAFVWAGGFRRAR